MKTQSKRIVTVNIADLKENKNQPRKEYDQEEIQALADNIKQLGQLDPIVIDKDNIILDGHRRVRAIKLLNYKTAEARVFEDMTDFEKNALILSKNILKKKFKPWEEREAIGKLFWDYFLEEFPQPTGVRDKGYTAFSKYIGISPTMAKKIIESTNPTDGRMQRYTKELKEAGATTNLVDEIFLAPVENRKHIKDLVIKSLKENKEEPRIREQVRIERRKIAIENSDNLPINIMKIIMKRIKDLESYLVSDILQKMDNEQKDKLKKVFEKRIIAFFDRL